MSIFRRIGDDLKEGLSKVPFLGSLMHLDVILVFGALAVMLVNFVLDLGIIENFLGAFDWYVFLVGLLLCWANRQTQFLYAGLFGFAGFQVLSFLMSIIRYGYFGFGTLVSALIYAGLGYLVLTKVKD